ncbi:hypothetical protein CAZ18_21560 [Pseudomonas aeruginosa]|nr:hypothetical protein CAY89_22340 [Pseudomonas aeruginosa]OTI37298.1 hypothetical protein CAY97_21265 [Pseudomonas aeruginosa]OTI43453.1 hypothetical protein CAZ18_21560 [Pseudomonas aeruginosa]
MLQYGELFSQRSLCGLQLSSRSIDLLNDLIELNKPFEDVRSLLQLLGCITCPFARQYNAAGFLVNGIFDTSFIFLTMISHHIDE